MEKHEPQDKPAAQLENTYLSAKNAVPSHTILRNDLSSIEQFLHSQLNSASSY
jgi:hypothetical protein